MKYAEDDKPLAVDPILKDVGGAEHPQCDLAEFFSTSNGAPEQRVNGQRLGFSKDFTCNDCGETGMSLV